MKALRFSGMQIKFPTIVDQELTVYNFCGALLLSFLHKKCSPWMTMQENYQFMIIASLNTYVAVRF